MSKRTVELELATPGLDARGQPVRVPLGVAAAPGTSDVAPPEPDLPGEHMLINLGPQHPATHGVLRLVVGLGTTSIDLGAFTPFLWAFQERERIYNLQEMWTGARLTTSVTRVGGLMADVPDDFVAGLREFTQTFPRTLSEIDRVLTRNG